MTGDLGRELVRKSFHMLSLAYLGAYWLIGWPRVLPWLALWYAVVAAVETARLYHKPFNELLMSPFLKFHRPEERDDYSGIFHTTGGALLAVAAFGAEARVVSAAICCLALGDAAAAVVGKSVGGPRLLGKKSWAGSSACLVACLAVGRFWGFGWGASLLAALAATAIELRPTTRWFNDNLWMPPATAVLYRLSL